MMPVRGGRGNPEGHDVVRRLGALGDRLGVQTIIFDRTIWSSRSPSGRPYTGVHPHYDHLHIELTREAGQTLTLPKLRLTVAGQLVAEVRPTVRPTIRQGARGEQVRALQRNLGGVSEDGVFGPKTAELVRKFQRANGLKVDGVVGRQTWRALGL
jgi:murein L,D-transpeptidase YcbB/YkuD